MSFLKVGSRIINNLQYDESCGDVPWILEITQLTTGNLQLCYVQNLDNATRSGEF